MAFVWQRLPEFEQVMINPGRQLPHDAFSDLVTTGVFLLMQLAFWCRLLYVPIPFRHPNTVQSHVLLFWAASVSFLAASFARPVPDVRLHPREHHASRLK